MKILHISDTHTLHHLLNTSQLEVCDLIIVSGDASNSFELNQNENQMRDFISWFKDINVKYKIYVPGNHDRCLENLRLRESDFLEAGIIYLNMSSITIEDLVIYGSPYTPSFGKGWAYNKSRTRISDIWQDIPKNVNILITHGPPLGHLDLAFDKETNEIKQVGCHNLRERIDNNQFPLLKLHCFGHIHENKKLLSNHGIKIHNGVIYSNAAMIIDGFSNSEKMINFNRPNFFYSSSDNIYPIIT